MYRPVVRFRRRYDVELATVSRLRLQQRSVERPEATVGLYWNVARPHTRSL